MSSFYRLLQAMQPGIFGFRHSQIPNKHVLTYTSGGLEEGIDDLTLAQLTQLREQLVRYLHQHGIQTDPYPPAPQNPPAGQQGTQAP